MDACAIAALTSPVCGGAPASGALPPAAAAPIACFSNLNSAVAPALQTAATSGLCVAATHRCQGAGDPFPSCGGKAAGNVVRVYSDYAALNASYAAMFPALAEYYYSGWLTTPDSVSRTVYIDALLVCNTEGW